MEKFTLGAQPTPLIFKCSNMNGAPLSGGGVMKDDHGRIVFSTSSGVQLPFKDHVEILRLTATNKNINIIAYDADGTTKRTLLTVSAGETYVGNLVLNGAETIRFEAQGAGQSEFQMLARAFGKGYF